MLIVIISVLIALGLRKAGISIPYFDNVIYAVKMKVAEMKSNKLQQALDRTLTSLDKPNPNQKNNKVTKPITSLHKPLRTFSGKMRI